MSLVSLAGVFFVIAVSGNGVEGARLRTEQDADRLLSEMLDGRTLTGPGADQVRDAVVESDWPFKQTVHCSKMNTRDYNYHTYLKLGRGEGVAVPKIEECGINVLSTDKDDEPTEKDTRQHSKTGNDWLDLMQTWLRQSLEGRSRRAAVVSEPELLDGKDTRVVGGQPAASDSWPWLVAIGSVTRGQFCGGTLIHSQYVVTAAHCFKDVEQPCNYLVRLGSRNWIKDLEGNHVDMRLEAIYRHPDYNDTTSQNDIALLKLASPVTLDTAGHINAICLPPVPRSAPVGTVCLAAGWGKLEEDSSIEVFEAREVEVPVMTYRDPCGAYKAGTMQPGMVCAGYREGQRDTCQGDSGGPLVYRKNNRWTLLGATSFGNGCARANYPGVYTDVGYHLSWIAAVIDRY